MAKSELYLVSPFDGNRWQKDELVVGNPFRRVRQLLGGGWQVSKGLLQADMAMAAIRGERRVLIIRFREDTTEEQARQIVENINADRVREESN